jgi:hypothetical protein
MTRARRNLAFANRVPYSLTMRSCPPVITSMFKSNSCAADGRLDDLATRLIILGVNRLTCGLHHVRTIKHGAAHMGIDVQNGQQETAVCPTHIDDVLSA